MARLHAGGATTDVTPDEPIPLSGYGAREGPFEGVHDPVRARALVLDDGASTVAVVSVDLLNVSRALEARVQRGLADANAPVDELLLAATHSHGAPYFPCPALDASEQFDAGGHDVSAFESRVRDGVVDAVATARERLEPATLRVGRAENDAVPVNRRAAGGVTGDVRVPHGETDPELIALVVETESGDETVMFNFSCHPTCTNAGESLVTADWPGVACDRIAEKRGARALFLNGTPGDVNPRDGGPGRSGEAVYEYMDEVGTAVGDTALSAAADADDADPVTDAQLLADREELLLPLRSTPPRERLDARIADLERELEADDGDRRDLADALAYARQLRVVDDWDATRVPVRLQYLELGGVGLLGVPGEVVVDYGLALKERASVDTLCPVGYTGDWVGYFPRLSDLDNGGYEVRMTRVAPEALAEFRERALALVE